MSSRLQIDSVIDDDDESCPLCIEEFDLSDKNFKPCPCGYQICQFCYNNIKTQNEEGRCPNCRRIYDDSTIEYRVPDANEFKADLASKHRKAAALKKKEAEKREIEASSRKNLAGVRVVQKNLVYVIGLNPTIRDENQLLQTLRTDQYFGQYGEIDKIVVSKAKPGGNSSQGIGVYVTFARKIDAATCIAAVDGSPNGDRVLRAQYGTTKYCSSFLRNEQCNNRNCTFLHETGEDTDSFSRQDLSSINTLSSQRPAPPNGQASTAGPSQPFPTSAVQRPPHNANQPVQPVTQAVRRQSSKEELLSRQGSSTDASALPSSASWANKDAPVNRARRASQAASRSSPSPKPVGSASEQREENKRNDKQTSQTQGSRRRETSSPSTANQSAQPSSSQNATSSHSPQRNVPLLDNLLKAVNSPDFRFNFSSAGLPPEEIALVESHPSLIDPYGGAKRRAMREKAEQEQAKQEAESQLLLQPSAAIEDENPESGSLQLGGEPEDPHMGRNVSGRNGREPQSAIQPPSQQGTASNSIIGSPISPGHQFQGLNVNGRSLTPLQQQQLLLLKSASNQQAGLSDPLQSAFGSNSGDSSQSRSGLFQNQMPHVGGGGMPVHARQSSRYNFDGSGKSTPNPRVLNQQQASLMQTAAPNPLSLPAQQGVGSQFYTSGVQGPPPGLKSAGTPPISGGGMFAQGHGFTSTMNNNLGLASNVNKHDANPELMRELLRGRGGSSNAIGMQGHEAAKREFMFSSLNSHHTPPPSMAPAPGLLSSLYGHQSVAYHDSVPQKQKKKGKKHRHANTSSGGGGVVDLADPSILQARMHQGSAATAQGLYGSQGQATPADLVMALLSDDDDEEFPPLGRPTKPKDNRATDTFGIPLRPPFSPGPRLSGRSGTPCAPPGLPLPHAHPTSALLQDSIGSPIGSPSKTPLGHGVAPAVPRLGTPIQRSRGQSRQSTPQAHESSPAPESRKNAKELRNSEISLGSPKMKSSSSSRRQSKADFATAAAAASPSNDVSQESPGVENNGSRKSRDASSKQRPLKLSTSTLATTKSESPSKAGTPLQSTPSFAAATLATAASSRPESPATGISRASDSPAPRQARVLRVVDTSSKAGTPPPAPSVATSARRSRKPSISSMSRPDTPGDIGSDYDLYTSASVSRANSPPPNRVGSAPVRAMTKSQVKKERKLKAKQAEEAAKKEEALSGSGITEEPVQAPIVGRKRKTKKAPASTTEPTANTEKSSEKAQVMPKASKENREITEQKVETVKKGKSKDKPANEVKKQQVVEEKTASSAPQKPVVEEAWRAKNTLGQLVIDAEATGVSIKDLFVERTSSLPLLLARLHQSGELDLNNHPLINPPNLNQRTDMRCVAEDLDMLKRPIVLNEDDRKQLLRGEAVRVNAKSGFLKNRCMITPAGCILRHLSFEEEERYLALEKDLSSSQELCPEYPPVSISEPDVTNRGGGLEALFATPEKFNIHWVDQAPRGGLTSDSADSPVMLPDPCPTGSESTTENDSSHSPSWTMGNTSDIVSSTTATVRSIATTAAKHVIGGGSNASNGGSNGSASGIIRPADIDEIINMSDYELSTMIDASQREVEVSKREVDAVDKKFMTLVKRNRKLAQQALGVAAELGCTGGNNGGK
ncbi:transcriptional repressor general negative regulator of transcription subunit 4 [Arachnomyces sp. PD_36]|nr:transcriptional repressor general negative regulator of transcription subunit 4 [Arachnomyces sp. PD_36]